MRHVAARLLHCCWLVLGRSSATLIGIVLSTLISNSNSTFLELNMRTIFSHLLLNSRQSHKWRCQVCSKTYSPSRHTHLCLPIPRSYLSAKDASSQQLAFINDAGRAVMKVDNSSVLKFPAKRNSIRIATKAKYTIGSLWVADMTHVPFGVSRFDYVLVVCLELLT